MEQKDCEKQRISNGGLGRCLPYLVPDVDGGSALLVAVMTLLTSWVAFFDQSTTILISLWSGTRYKGSVQHETFLVTSLHQIMCLVDKHLETRLHYLMHLPNTLLHNMEFSWTGVRVATNLNLVSWIELQ